MDLKHGTDAEGGPDAAFEVGSPVRFGDASGGGRAIIIRHLPDPPVRGFNSDKVNLSDTAYGMGAPDGTLALASFALNLPLALSEARRALASRDARVLRGHTTAFVSAGASRAT